MILFRLKSLLTGSACAAAIASSAYAANFDIPGGELRTALNTYAAQSGIQLVVSGAAIQGVHTRGVKGNLPVEAALARILAGTGLTMRRESSAVAIVPAANVQNAADNPVQEAQAFPRAAAATGIESVVVTSSKIKGDIQTVPIAITALSQEQLTSRQIAGGPDLIKEVPNLTFSKTNFSGYNLEIRGIGTQAISVTTDPAVAVAFNDIPFIRNHFFEQEFFDVGQVQVLRGPQGTLYGRNATAGVVNIISAKPTDEFEAMASADIGNYRNRRFEAMINIPVVDDRFDVRIAGEWTKRNGYTQDTTLNTPVDGRDLWSGRVTIAYKPVADLQTYLVWEHFGESDDRLRTGKQLCETALPPASVDGVIAPPPTIDVGAVGNAGRLGQAFLSQSCQATSLYSASAFEVPYGPSLPTVLALQAAGRENYGVDPYAETTQSRNLRDIQSAILPHYRAKNDTLEFNADYKLNSALTLTSQTGYNQDFLSSTEDYDRFDTTPGIFKFRLAGTPLGNGFSPDPNIPGALIFCDPQLGCSDRLVFQDLNNEHAWQLSQEFRLASNFSGPFNFSVGGNYLHYETEENYYVFANAFSAYSLVTGGGGGNGTPNCLTSGNSSRFIGSYQNPNPVNGGGEPTYACVYVDLNPMGSLNNEGHNYYLNQNPYMLNSYAGFGEAYYAITQDLKLTAGLRWTDDQKHFVDIPSQLLDQGYGFWTTGIEKQEWDQLTGRGVLNWTPKLDFTDQTLVYASYSHGYKAGGANPPGAIFLHYVRGDVPSVAHPLTFKPEFIDAYELGSKNALLDGALTLNGDIFYYNYTGYQISEIVDRTAINNNYNAHVEGAELESNWEPLPGLRFNFAGGWEDATAARGASGIDLMDRTGGHPGWMIVKPFPTQASNCILPDYVVAALMQEQYNAYGGFFPGAPPGTGDNSAEAGAQSGACGVAYALHQDPVTQLPYVPNPTVGAGGEGIGCFVRPCTLPAGYPGFDPTQPAINNGEGFLKNLSGNQLPNAPHFTTSLSAEYTMPVSEDWAATLHSDFYWQSQSMARIFNDRPYDKIRGYSTTNLALILTSADGWQVIGYLKNVFNVTAITGDFLNSDDSGLTTNVFLTDPRLYGVRVTKNF
jgi:iron complex outermembrane recepter protein